MRSDMSRYIAIIVFCLSRSLSVIGAEAGALQGEKDSPSTHDTRPKTLDLGQGVNLEMVWIPPGSYVMGSPPLEVHRDLDEGPQHIVTLSKGFWMGKHETTQRQYQQIMGTNPSHYKETGLDAPVESVDWNEAKAFCRKLQEKFPTEWKEKTVDLPTEAEWEYACRAGTGSAMHNGKSSRSDPDSVLRLNPRKQTIPVGQRSPNAWGLYDMLGNVWEWCADGKRTYTSAAVTDPRGEGKIRVIRGGELAMVKTQTIRSACRNSELPDAKMKHIGFRVIAR